ncbi:sigma-70 family RNA polymerase sigma factor [Chitinophaga sp. SYP-B3965]|uniref:RNA polymerase sigma factor n=1 Tax=Chitinophaga sp. SYP-B3965 TaxID=2663120 RepID=UPI001299840D|nr:sigma-70 family RNA polymerase sigma factor [Chitinophaga sp. SYP-B3965]MRG45831.1 sigma-70 family RNA polymerase sigma factor [Chitinophaga sp. SYP-B3965]
MKNLPDVDLMELVKEENDNAFEILLNRHSKALYDLVYKRTRSDADTKDIIQDIFISVWKNRQTITIETSLYPYLYRAAKYAVIDLTIRNRKVLAFQEILMSAPMDIDPGAEQITIAQELKQEFEAEVANMPSTMRDIFRLSRDEKLSSREIAQRLQLSEQTVRNNITLALNRLRVRFKANQLLVLVPPAIYFTSL